MSLGDPKAEQSRTDKIRAKEARKAAMFKAIMDTAQGREWMYSLLAECHCFATSFSKSALEMSFQEGERNIGLKLTDRIVRLAPEDYVKMLREHHGEKYERDGTSTSGRVLTDDVGDSSDGTASPDGGIPDGT